MAGTFKGPAVTLGNFDGVHLGHRDIFKRLKKRAAEIGGQSLILTFDPHPVKVLRPDAGPRLITPLKKKLRLFDEVGVDGVILADFTKAFAAQHPLKFAEDVLYKKINARLIMVGHDFTFGKGKEGTIDSLMEFGRKIGFDVEVVRAYKIDGQIVSSTLIRELIVAGDVKKAAVMLGRNYTIEGRVTTGHSRGKSLGFPTANLDLHGELFPKDGVYAATVKVGGRLLDGVVNVGLKPTFGDRERTVEVHSFDFDHDIYNKDVRLSFVERVRDEKCFPGPDELVDQIRRDVITAKSILGYRRDRQ